MGKSIWYYKQLLKFKPNQFPISKECYENTMAIPFQNKMSKKDYIYVIDQIKKIKKLQ